MTTNERYEKAIKRFGLAIRPITGTRELLSVQYKGIHLFSIPSKMKTVPDEKYRPTGLNMRHQTFHELFFKARWYWFKAKVTPMYKQLQKEAVKQRFVKNYEEID